MYKIKKPKPLWLAQLSPSSSWTVADVAWENDLEPLEEAA